MVQIKFNVFISWFIFVHFNLKICVAGASVLCGRTQQLELGGAGGAAAALALVRPRSHAPCRLRLSAPNHTAFLVRLMDVKDPLWDLDRLDRPAGKWAARSAARHQDTEPAPAPPTAPNRTEPCTLSIYSGDSTTPDWRLSACGANAAALAARAGVRLFPPRVRLVWMPPAAGAAARTERLRLIVTAVNSGAACNQPTELPCGSSGLCVWGGLACDGVRHCPGGEDEEASACAARAEPPLLELLRRLAARHQELVGLEVAGEGGVVGGAGAKGGAVVVPDDKTRKDNAFVELGAALKPYGPWGYLVVGMLICATVLMFCLAWECCCRRDKPSQPIIPIPAACVAPSPTAFMAVNSPTTAVASGAGSGTYTAPTPPAYEAPPSYSSLFPRAFKSSPTPVAHCSHEAPD